MRTAPFSVTPLIGEKESPTIIYDLVAGMFNLEAFIEQARDYEAISNTVLGEMLKQAQTEQLTHPVPVLRAKEIDRWASSQDYHHLLETGKTEYNQKAKAKGGWRNW